MLEFHEQIFLPEDVPFLVQTAYAFDVHGLNSHLLARCFLDREIHRPKRSLSDVLAHLVVVEAGILMLSLGLLERLGVNLIVLRLGDRVLCCLLLGHDVE